MIYGRVLAYANSVYKKVFIYPHISFSFMVFNIHSVVNLSTYDFGYDYDILFQDEVNTLRCFGYQWLSWEVQLSVLANYPKYY